MNGHGIAVYRDRELVAAFYGRGLGGALHPLLETVGPFEEALAAIAPIEELVIELPQVYDSAHQKGDQEDLIRLAVVVGALLCAARPYVRGALLVEPRTWKGNTPKLISRDRVSAKLSQAEHQRIDLPHNDKLRLDVWDAVALGYWRAT